MKDVNGNELPGWVSAILSEPIGAKELGLVWDSQKEEWYDPEGPELDLDGPLDDFLSYPYWRSEGSEN